MLTDQEREIKRLHSKIKRMERVSCQKAYFYGELCHDLRQPLQALKIFIALLQEEKLNTEQKKLLSKIESSTSGLEAWIDNLLAIARLESGGIQRCNKTFSLQMLMAKIAKEYQEIAVYKKINFVASGEEISITTDNILLERIIRNLLHNAFKYNRGMVAMRWYKTVQTVKIIIRDNGFGLRQEECRKLFRAFYQCPRNREQGTGLGLAIVKELSDILGADIKVKSKYRRGTMFVFSLPQNTNPL